MRLLLLTSIPLWLSLTLATPTAFDLEMDTNGLFKRASTESKECVSWYCRVHTDPYPNHQQSYWGGNNRLADCIRDHPCESQVKPARKPGGEGVQRVRPPGAPDSWSRLCAVLPRACQ